MISTKLTYLFYDIETTGLDKSFDQVLQFAAIRTDQELNELSREQFYVKLSPDIIPSPYATMTHRIAISKTQSGLTELEAIQKIHGLMNEPGTISCGYNTLGFDDEFLRFSFYRHLLRPYTHQYLNNCGRMDIYPMTVMYYLYNNSVIKWPDNKGKPSLKLEDINTSNQFFLGSAHDAMVDVEVTLALAKCFIKSRKIWDYLLGYFNKDIDRYRLGEWESAQILLIDGKFGSDLFYQWPVIYLGQHNVYKNQGIFLRLDMEDINENTWENAWVFRKKLGELGFLLPMSGHYVEKLNEKRMGWVNKNLEWIKNNPSIFESIRTYHRNYIYPVVENVDVDSALYLDGFLSNEDERLCLAFHQADPPEKVKIIKMFNNENLKNRAIRVMGRYYLDYLPEDFREIFSNYLNQVCQGGIINYKGEKRLSVKRCLDQAKELGEQNLDLEQKKLLNELEGYLQRYCSC